MKNYSNEVTEINTQLELIRAQRRELQLSNDAKVKDLFDATFNYFREYDIIVSSMCACFFDAGDNKQLFTINFYERYKEDARLELSYYTTSTQSEFELNRLISLGKVAQLIKSNSERIMRDIADIRNSDKERENELYAIQSTYEKKIAEYRKAELEDRKVQIELQLRGEGVQFVGPIYFLLKRNYDPRITSIKILEVSKSGKTCTVQYVTAGQSVGKEERCDVESVISQVIANSKNIV
ncbi:hypothetical protein UFOVP54_106 [uncultured Caudovirales phage]|uniref:Uncharacterized protein n=1 Tax=uncultured Caudovirales phage TaxID=2100421 RepID=A0A6J5KWE5_9CAUD|nr:hypothetical protein UFOVP54_106 [uncultured Caudovirales phage]